MMEIDERTIDSLLRLLDELDKGYQSLKNEGGLTIEESFADLEKTE